MDREQKRRMANRSVVQDSEDGEVEYTIQVSGDRVELHKSWDAPWDNESGTGPDQLHECWTMDLELFKKFLNQARICVDQSEAFEAKHPLGKIVEKSEAFEAKHPLGKIVEKSEAFEARHPPVK